MKKRQAKQVYFLLLAIFGIVAISVYSTYAIFTLESSSDDIVSIHTPDNLHISASTYEYKQLTVPKNAYVTTDLDVYNNLDTELCYSIWYKPLEDENKINVYENTTESLTTSSVIPAVTSKRIQLLITNDSDKDIKVNIGLTYEKNEGTCTLNIESGRLSINNTISAKSLAKTLTSKLEIKSSEAGYLTYHDLTKEITLDKEKTYYVASEFTYKDELFTLKEPQTLDFEKINTYQNNYLCLDGDKCQTIYHLLEVNNEAKITKYNLLIGYLAGENGIRKINNDYYYYGDNPQNFIYYNCANDQDLKSCELWRIMGFHYDTQNNEYLTKLIKNDYLESHIFDESINTWNGSSINKYLNEEYKLKNDNLVTEYSFKEENIISLDSNLNEIALLDQENKAKIMLMQVSDYLYATNCKKDKINEYDESCLKNNWLNKNTSELTMTTKYEDKHLDEETNEEIIPDNNMIYLVGNSLTEVSINTKQNIRPVIYLKGRTLLTSGDGSLDNPYVIR